MEHFSPNKHDATTQDVVLQTPEEIAIAQLMILKQAVRLEAVGMKHSSGKSMRKAAAKALHMSSNTSHDTLIGALSREIDQRIITKNAAKNRNRSHES